MHYDRELLGTAYQCQQHRRDVRVEVECDGAGAEGKNGKKTLLVRLSVRRVDASKQTSDYDDTT